MYVFICSILQWCLSSLLWRLQLALLVLYTKMMWVIFKILFFHRNVALQFRRQAYTHVCTHTHCKIFSFFWYSYFPFYHFSLKHCWQIYNPMPVFVFYNTPYFVLSFIIGLFLSFLKKILPYLLNLFVCTQKIKIDEEVKTQLLDGLKTSKRWPTWDAIQSEVRKLVVMSLIIMS